MKTDTRNAMATSDVVESLLRRIRENLYPDSDSEFHKDRKRLVHTITWIANWMERRGLATSPKAYYTLISRQVADIVEHGQQSTRTLRPVPSNLPAQVHPTAHPPPRR